jgi:hypothetical protein
MVMDHATPPSYMQTKSLKYLLLDNNETMNEIESVRRVFDSTKNNQKFQVPIPPEASAVGEIVRHSALFSF